MDRLSFALVVLGLLAALVCCGDATNDLCFENFTESTSYGFQLKAGCEKGSITLTWNTTNDLLLWINTDVTDTTKFNITVDKCVLEYNSTFVGDDGWKLTLGGETDGMHQLRIHKNGTLSTRIDEKEVGCAGKNVKTDIGGSWSWTTIRVDAPKNVKYFKFEVYLSGSSDICKYDSSKTTSMAPNPCTQVETTSPSTTESSTVLSTTSETTKSTVVSTTPSTTTSTTVLTTTEATTPSPTELTATVTKTTTDQTTALESSSQVPPVALKPTKKKSDVGVVVGASAGVIILLLFGLGLSGGWCLYRRNKHSRQREEAKTARRNARRIVDHPAQQKQKKQKSEGLRGKVIPGLPPPGPVGYKPDRISARQFKHMGPLKMEQKPPVIMVHELNDDETVNLTADQHIVWDDQENLVYDIGSEVEQVYHKGKKIAQPKRAPKAPARRTAEARNLKAIRED